TLERWPTGCWKTGCRCVSSCSCTRCCGAMLPDDDQQMISARNPKAVVLLSGGLDSSTIVAMAAEQGFEIHALSVSYGQRHQAELAAASRVAAVAGVRQHQLISINLDAMGGSALTDINIAVPESPSAGIPSTYV